MFELGFAPGFLLPTCDVPGSEVKVAGLLAKIDTKARIDMVGSKGEREVKVEFVGPEPDLKRDAREIRVPAGETVEVKCEY